MTFQNKAQVASWLTYLNQVSLGTPSEVMGVVTSLITGQPIRRPGQDEHGVEHAA